MTIKRYPETKSLSRSRKIRHTGPFPDHFAAAQPPATNGEHPIDLFIDAMPDVASRRRKLVRMAKRWQAETRDKQAYIAYEDARLEYFVLREQLYFNAGYERGLIAGRVESREANTATLTLAHRLALAVASADLPKPRIAVALLDLARAAVLGLPLR